MNKPIYTTLYYTMIIFIMISFIALIFTFVGNIEELSRTVNIPLLYLFSTSITAALLYSMSYLSPEGTTMSHHDKEAP